jgi:hypothetical protein
VCSQPGLKLQKKFRIRMWEFSPVQNISLNFIISIV